MKLNSSPKSFCSGLEMYIGCLCRLVKNKRYPLDIKVVCISFSSLLIYKVRMNKVSPTLLIITLFVGTLSISSGAIFVRLIDDVPSMMIATYRMVFSAIILFAMWKGGRNDLSSVSRSDFKLCVFSGFFLAFHFATWIDSLNYTSVANSVMLVNMNPLFIAVFAYIFFKERQSFAIVISIVIAIIGCFVLTSADGGLDMLSGGSDVMTGNLLAIAGAVGSSLYLLVGSRVMERMNILTYVLIVYSSSAVMLTVFSALMGYDFFGYKISSYIYLTLMAFFPQVLGHSSFNWALKYMRSSTVSVIKMGEPIGAAVMAYFIFSESVGFVQGIGMLMIFSAIILALREGD